MSGLRWAAWRTSQRACGRTSSGADLVLLGQFAEEEVDVADERLALELFVEVDARGVVVALDEAVERGDEAVDEAGLLLLVEAADVVAEDAVPGTGGEADLAAVAGRLVGQVARASRRASRG